MKSFPEVQTLFFMAGLHVCTQTKQNPTTSNSGSLFLLSGGGECVSLPAVYGEEAKLVEACLRDVVFLVK